MQVRTITYTERPASDPSVAGRFRIIEAQSEDGLHHALAVPRGWVSVNAPVDPDPRAPALGAVHLESRTPGPEHGVIVAGHLALDAFDDARSVVDYLASKDGFSVADVNEAGGDGLRALARTDTHRMVLRVQPHGPVWAFASAVIPDARIAELGGALRATLESFRLPPAWTAPIA